MLMPALSTFFRTGRPLRPIPTLALFAIAALASPATAEEAPLPYDAEDEADTSIAQELESGIGESSARYLQSSDIDENIILPSARAAAGRRPRSQMVARLFRGRRGGAQQPPI